MRFGTSTSIVALAVAAMAVSDGARAQAVNTTPSNVNVLNLLSPFLALNATATGRATLQGNLDQAVATNNGSTPARRSLAVSDKNLLGNAANTLGTSPVGTQTVFGVASNLAGGLPAQAPTAGSTVVPMQPVGGYGSQLGPIYVRGVANGTAGPLNNVVTLLTTAYNGLTSNDLGVAKNYFANGAATNPSVTPPGYVPVPAVAPAGYSLPTFNGLPNTTTSVLDIAAGVTNTQPGQDIYGSSRPVQVAPGRFNQFDPTSVAGLTTNPSFPSGHTTYGYTDGILLAMLTPSLYQSQVLRASEYGNSRVVLDVHYPLDIIASRALSSYDLAQAFTNPLYVGNASTTGTAINLPSLFAAAQPQLANYLSAQCGAAVATCAASAANTANDPYVPSAANQAVYKQRLTYGLPTLSFDQAPREAAPAGGPDAAILLAPIYGGSTAAAAAIAPNGGLDGRLQTGTIDQILVNTENNALASFYGTALSYWTRIDLYAAAGYFGNVAGALTLASADRVTTPVTIGGTGTLYGNGAVITGNVTAAAGGVFGGGSATAATATTINGNLALQSGVAYAVTAANGQLSSTTVNGAASIAGSTLRVVAAGTQLPFTQQQVLNATGGLTGTFASAVGSAPNLNSFLSYGANSATLTLDRTDVSFAVPGATTNQARVAGALTAAAPTAQNAGAGALLNGVFANEQASPALGRATLDSISGEGIAAAQNAAFQSSAAFMSSIEDEQNAWRSPTSAAPNGVTLGSALPRGAQGYADAASLPFPATKGPLPVLAAPPRLWRAWGGGFGGSSTINGVASLGTARQTDDFFGGLVGIDYQARPDLLIGAAVGGTSADFSVRDRATTGTVTGGHGALYATYGTLSGFYLQSSLGFSGFSNDVRRTAGGVGAVGGEVERASFDSFEVRVRGEVGQRFGFGGVGYGSVGVTPFAAVEYANLSTDGFAETNAATGAPGALGLAVAGRTTESLPVFAGLRLDSVMAVGDGMVARPFTQVAYIHEFDPTRNLLNSVVSLPGASFLVEGARPAEDAAQVKAGLDLAVRPNVSLFASFDGEFSGVETVYAGKGGLRVSF